MKSTFDVNCDRPINFWLRVNLAFVDARIFSLSCINPQLPVTQRFIG